MIVRSVGYDITLNFKDSPEPNQYYQWKWTHYERPVYCLVSAGKAYQCSESCFDISFSSTYNILSDKLLNGQEITNYPIARVPYDGNSLYYLKIEQRAISEKLFKYFRSIKDVNQGSGTLFDVPAETRFSPNVFSVDNPNEKILGAFEVFGVEEKIVYIDRFIGSEEYSPVRKRYLGEFVPRLGAPCVEGRYRTKIEPKDWKE